ncbi:hypothetical protein DYU05_04030 [Mucilaginibacter terrenus]|uniref:Uncharacterized protein n=1 Tax=Mucilaginibacter terrenus TaxID=2482727 RepID=A0A3E2NUV0_9SPHI|nr:hypothetical protein [Mucilaginibacter terrenus]RFZ84784.1 hypothetical protein DYU05_04030 [Mucilaginibacter terrenus]
MNKVLNVWRFQRLSESLENRNWYKGYLFMETPNGNVIVTIDHRHFAFWQAEFGVTLEDIESRLLPPIISPPSNNDNQL